MSTPVARSSFDGIFPPAVRRLGIIYAAAAIPVMTGLSLLIPPERGPYLVIFSMPAILVFGTPGMVFGWLAACWASPATMKDRPAYLVWFAALVLIVLTGLAMMVGLITGSRVANFLGQPVVVAIAVLLIAGIVRLTRSRSGQRAFSVDIIEALMVVIVVAAPGILIWGERIVGAEESWYTIPSGLATVGMIFGAYWAIALVVRLGPNARAVDYFGLGFTLLGTADAAAQVAQGLSGFTLPVAPLMALHISCTGMMFLVPLHLRRSACPGLDRLPPQAQVRVGYLATLVTFAGLATLVVTTALVDERTSWAAPFSLGVAAALVLLAGLRHLAGVQETRQLYNQIERVSDQRRRLLAQVMERADEDRHRAAAQLHEQAVSAYTSVVSLLGASRTPGQALSSLAGASDHLRDDLASQADSLRHLMLAIQPLQADRSGTRTLAAPIQAYLDNLYGDRPVPRLTVSTAAGLFLDWPTETIVLRIVQEALRNVWRHSQATHVQIRIDVADQTITLHVSDDGRGFDPASTGFRSGIAAMRAFAAVMDGSVGIDSSPGAGTTLVARLGHTRRVTPPSVLRLLRSPEHA